MLYVNLWGAFVYAIGAYLPDKHKLRFLPLVLCAPIGIAGYAILLSNVPPAVRYFATYLIATACFLCTGTNIAWLSGNRDPDGKRAASLSILLTLTNIGDLSSLLLPILLCWIMKVAGIVEFENAGNVLRVVQGKEKTGSRQIAVSLCTVDPRCQIRQIGLFHPQLANPTPEYERGAPLPN
ncbi:hypothetical protein DL95DRAFT_492104 [Leptodontidium sp. 2 PMI_412]|nr:hypothetical protein DL95DRAFT_492104 [Leptodontidium sp. 2 PMI_412]